MVFRPCFLIFIGVSFSNLIRGLNFGKYCTGETISKMVLFFFVHHVFAVNVRRFLRVHEMLVAGGMHINYRKSLNYHFVFYF